jgi:hypothetical protein
MNAVEVDSEEDQTTPSGITRKEYVQIRSQLVFTKSFVPTLGILALDAMLLAVARHLVPNPPWYRLRGARAPVNHALSDRDREPIGIGWSLRHRTQDLQAIVDRYRVVSRADASHEV